MTNSSLEMHFQPCLFVYNCLFTNVRQYNFHNFRHTSKVSISSKSLNYLVSENFIAFHSNWIILYFIFKKICKQMIQLKMILLMNSLEEGPYIFSSSPCIIWSFTINEIAQVIVILYYSGGSIQQARTSLMFQKLNTVIKIVLGKDKIFFYKSACQPGFIH